jgi:hypothetical protein
MLKVENEVWIHDGLPKRETVLSWIRSQTAVSPLAPLYSSFSCSRLSLKSSMGLFEENPGKVFLKGPGKPMSVLA